MFEKELAELDSCGNVTDNATSGYFSSLLHAKRYSWLPGRPAGIKTQRGGDAYCLFGFFALINGIYYRHVTCESNSRYLNNW